MRFDPQIKRIAATYREWASRRAIRNSTAIAERTLPADPIGILVDSNVYHHTVTHETGWISTGEKMFGPTIKATGHAARVPVFRQGSDAKDYENVCYLAAIAQLAKIGRARLWTSHHLLLERDGHPRGRFADVGWFDFNLFGRGELPSIDGDPSDEMLMTPFSFNKPPPDDITTVLSRSDDKLYLGLIKVMGQKN